MKISKKQRPSKVTPNKDDDYYEIDMSPENDIIASKVNFPVQLKEIDDYFRNDPIRVGGWELVVKVSEVESNKVKISTIVELENPNDAVHFGLSLGIFADMPAWAAPYQSVVQPDALNLPT